MEKLVEVTRGALVESEHWGSIAVADAEGNLLARAGNPDLVTYFRSSAKPIQAIPVITSGAARKFALTKAELAIICASHSGEEEHIRVVGGILNKLGLSPDALLCGVHPPLHGPSAAELWKSGRQPRTVHCNCSGKHSGMLAICLQKGWPIDNYLDLNHPLQQLLLETMREYHAYQEIVVGIDGCGVPVYGMPLRVMARGYAKLVSPQADCEEIAGATGHIVDAMTAYPGLVAGTDRFDTILMSVTGGRLLAKEGAEGVQCIGVKDRGIGIAIKIMDGARRATGPVAVEVLRQLGVLSETELTALSFRHHGPIKNHRGETVGELRPVFQLKF